MAGQVKDKEAFQRLSYLYQAAHCILAQNPDNQALARFYCHTERTIGKRLVLRQDPSVKRTLCRGCSSLLIPGVTCTQRQRRRLGQRWTVQTCLTCHRSRRFLNDPRHQLWGDRPEAQLGNQTDPKLPRSVAHTSHPVSAQPSEEKLQHQDIKIQ
ncbi:ribonuclease P protein subunit p21 [Dromiciops gliroides]|uniref:ribonuclease P protein subunit p21 n=1 Tax=Dromiciops gliroides TaxID=33562 RepID=UPI001CC74078|nr:ribonuclease P protein subunit p21 [Dromiciops gliroides]